MSNAIKATIQGLDRQTLITLVKAERRNIQITNSTVVNGAQTRAIEHYEAHLLKVQRKLDPNNNYAGMY